LSYVTVDSVGWSTPHPANSTATIRNLDIFSMVSSFCRGMMRPTADRRKALIGYDTDNAAVARGCTNARGMQNLYQMSRPSITEDFRRLARYAVITATVLAWLCPLLPEPYRVPCHALAQLCSLSVGGH
jgi:hypothetical protein